VRRLALLLAGGALWLVLAAVPVFADNGPHQAGASATTDGCSGCHRAHTARAANLLVSSTQTALCYTCHGTTGTGATTDVQDGVQYAPVTTTKVLTTTRTGSGSTTFAGALRGGGFDNAAINSAPATNASAIGVISPYVATSSRHDVGQAGTAWGNGAIGSGAGVGVAITCGSCHDPHGNGSYRILQVDPENLGPNPVTIADVGNNTYRYTTTDYWQPGDVNAPQYLSSVTGWCSTCHTRYNAPTGSGHTNSGDPIFTYRHATTNNLGLQCVQCHVAHGSNATMGTNSQAVPLPGQSGGRGPDSSLLRINNRGVCEKCHEK
jgi:predicted CXXCH cytochrome family protein